MEKNFHPYQLIIIINLGPTRPTVEIKRSQFLTQLNSNINNSNEHSGKKRKANSPILESTSHKPMFPFTFGPSQPLPTNSYSPNTNIENKTELAKSVATFIINFLKNIHTVEDINTLDNKIIIKEVEQFITNS